MIDLRSDICSAPTDEMWDAMRAARLGWATLGEDENVNALEQPEAAPPWSRTRTSWRTAKGPPSGAPPRDARK
jgi:hypothetical protein